MGSKDFGALRPQPTRHAAFDREDDVPVTSAVGARCPLGPLEQGVLNRVNGLRTIGEIARQVRLTTAEVAALVARLRELGALEAGADVALEDGWDTEPVIPTLPPPTKPGGSRD